MPVQVIIHKIKNAYRKGIQQPLRHANIQIGNGIAETEIPLSFFTGHPIFYADEQQEQWYGPCHVI